MTWRPGRSFRLGAMRERITVQSLAVSISSGGDKAETWTTLYSNEPAAFDSVSGGETLRGRQVEDGINAVFTVHYRTTFEPTQRITHGGTTYGIVYVKPVDGGRRYIELYCRSA